MTTETTSFEAAWKGFCARLDQISAENKELRRTNLKLGRDLVELRLERRWQAQRIAQMQDKCVELRAWAYVAAAGARPASETLLEVAEVLDAILKEDPSPPAL